VVQWLSGAEVRWLSASRFRFSAARFDLFEPPWRLFDN